MGSIVSWPLAIISIGANPVHRYFNHKLAFDALEEAKWLEHVSYYIYLMHVNNTCNIMLCSMHTHHEQQMTEVEFHLPIK